MLHSLHGNSSLVPRLGHELNVRSLRVRVRLARARLTRARRVRASIVTAERHPKSSSYREMQQAPRAV